MQQLLLNLGIVSAIRLRREAFDTAAREAAEYATQAQYEVIIDKANRDRFAEVIGFIQERKQRQLTSWIANKKRGIQPRAVHNKVALIEDAGTADVYDTTVPVVHSHSRERYSYIELWRAVFGPVRRLQSRLDQRRPLRARRGKRPIGTSWRRRRGSCVRFLDDVIDINPYPLEEVRAKVTANRRIGLGIMGWAELLFELGLRYDSDEAIALGERLMTSIRDWSRDGLGGHCRRARGVPQLVAQHLSARQAATQLDTHDRRADRLDQHPG